jgi:hypothetical protein
MNATSTWKVHRYSGGKYTPVRGWRCIDYGTHMTFYAHSIVLTDEDLPDRTK